MMDLPYQNNGLLVNDLAESKPGKTAEWIGSITGIIGALIVALNTSYSQYGYLLFLASNIALFVFAVRAKRDGICLMTVFQTGTTLIGIYCWF